MFNHLGSLQMLSSGIALPTAFLGAFELLVKTFAASSPFSCRPIVARGWSITTLAIQLPLSFCVIFSRRHVSGLVSALVATLAPTSGLAVDLHFYVLFCAVIGGQRDLGGIHLRGDIIREKGDRWRREN